MRLCSVWHFVILIVLILGLSAFRFIPCSSPALLCVPGYDSLFPGLLLPGLAGQWGCWQETGGQRKGEARVFLLLPPLEAPLAAAAQHDT